MLRSEILLVLVPVLFSSVGCGSGTWRDDPGNWERAFESSKPADVVVLRSEYERGFHWTYEFSYFFEIAPNTALKDRVRSGGLVKVMDRGSCVEPDWFTPKPQERYEVWGYTDRDSDFQMFVDTETDTLFLSDCLI